MDGRVHVVNIFAYFIYDDIAPPYLVIVFQNIDREL